MCGRHQSVERNGRRSILSNVQAREIFRLKPECQANRRGHSAAQLATKYGVSAKAIRDIWNTRTWYWATHDLEQNPSTAERPEKKTGRPKGARDIQPRKRKRTRSQLISPLVEAAGSKVTQLMRAVDIRLEDAISSINTTDKFIDPFHGDWAFWSDSSRDE